MTLFAIWLEEPACLNIALVGGKVANLSRLAAAYRVPSGLCLTTTAYTQWNEHGEEWTAELRDQLAAAYATMAQRSSVEQPPVAVRSSAIDEDGGDASFAGQYETYLNIVGVDAIADAVSRCWQATRSPQVLEYRRQNNLPVDDIKIAVLVQQMVPADVAGVAFSANPVNNNRNEIVINSSWGLGESVVGGTVSPDAFVVSKNDLQINETQIAEKLRMTVSHATGTHEVAVPRFMRTQPTLDDHKTLEIARLTIALEDEMGWPVDIEYAYHGDELYLLQCRPITTLD
ncbi:MAG: phosphoenolpyruvate synthase/pyruvate phosphate dikinase [Candidatus Latescibacterota bacterium]